MGEFLNGEEWYEQPRDHCLYTEQSLLKPNDSVPHEEIPVPTPNTASELRNIGEIGYYLLL